MTIVWFSIKIVGCPHDGHGLKKQWQWKILIQSSNGRSKKKKAPRLYKKYKSTKNTNTLYILQILNTWYTQINKKEAVTVKDLDTVIKWTINEKSSRCQMPVIQSSTAVQLIGMHWDRHNSTCFPLRFFFPFGWYLIPCRTGIDVCEEKKCWNNFRSNLIISLARACTTW